MERITRLVGSALAMSVVTAAQANAQAGQGAISFADEAWSFQGDSIRAESIDGRTALSMRNGVAYRRDLRLEDGTIDLDVMTTRKRSFVYVMFRMQNDSAYEDFYLRPHKSGAPDALQYAPVYQASSAWQLYHGATGTASAEFEPNVWNHLRIVLRGRQAAVFLGDTIKPVMVVPRLGHEPRAGFIGLRVFLPAGIAVAGPLARFSNLRVRPGYIPFAFPTVAEPAPLPGLVHTWMVGDAFATPDSVVAVIPAGTTSHMRPVDALANGLLELHRLVPLKTGVRDVAVVARLTVVADAAGTYLMNLGFSDRVTAFVNGRPVFHGDDSYDYANRRDGLIGLNQAKLFLPLRAGKNVLEFVVSDVFGGWGLMGQLPARSVRVVDP